MRLATPNVLGAGLNSQERNRQILHTFGMQVVSIASRPQCEADETATAPLNNITQPFDIRRPGAPLLPLV